MKRIVVFIVGALFLILVAKHFMEDHQFKKELETDPDAQSLFRVADAINIVKGRSFSELNRRERQKVVMKCAEAYALIRLPYAQPLDEHEPRFIKYLHGLNILAHTDTRSPNVRQADQAVDMVRDYIWSRYDACCPDY